MNRTLIALTVALSILGCGCIHINATYSKLSPGEREKIHVTSFDSSVAPVADPKNINDIYLKAITTEQLRSLVAGSKKKYQWVLFYTSGCHGTPYILPYVNEVRRKYLQDVDIFVVASDDYATVNNVKSVLVKYGIGFQTYVADEKYGEHFDDRKKGYIMRQQLCSECTETIGVPYNIVFNGIGIVAFHGYRNYSTVNDSVTGEDFVGNLVNRK